MRDYSRVISEGWPSTWPPSAPPFQAAESELVRIDDELAASLTVQFWAIRSRGRLLDLAGQQSYQLGRTRRGIRNSVTLSQNDVPCTTVVRHTEEPTAVRADI